MVATAPQLGAERDRQRELMDRKRKAARGIVIRRIADPERRARCLADPYAFLETYFPAKFTDPWTDDRREMVESVLRAAREGGDQAIAGPRGEGKTTIVECLTIYCLLSGLLRFPLIAAATGPDADRILSNLKYEVEINDRLGGDFPEVCDPIRALEGAPQRANMQTFAGERTRMRWSGNSVVLPTVDAASLGEQDDPWSADEIDLVRRSDGHTLASGSALMTRGLDAAIRGIRVHELRPDLVVIDDPETRESAQSEKQTHDRELVIEQDIGGLGGPGKRIARVMLCTVMNRKSLAYRYTDPQQKPSWHGRRYRLLVSKPDREDLWDHYCLLRQQGMASGEDPQGREATEYLLDRWDEMHAGAEVANPERYIKDEREDGTAIEHSALQHCFNLIADRGYDSFATEYQNDPPEEEGPEESGITSHLVQQRVNGVPKGLVPAGAECLTAGVDVGKYHLHWTVTAWMAGAQGAVVDYGVHDVHSPTGSEGSDEAVKEGTLRAILTALHELREQWMETPYRDEGGGEHPISVALVDAGHWDTAVYQFIRETGGRPFKPSKGFGSKPRQSPFRAPKEKAKGRILGEHWYAGKQSNGLWLVGLDSDYWKRWLHDRLMTPADRPGSLTLFGGRPDDPKAEASLAAFREHQSYAKHLTAEVEVEEFVPGKGMRRYWKQVRGQNHWLDSTYMACAAGAMVGVSLMPSSERRAAKSKAEAKPAGEAGEPERPRVQKQQGGRLKSGGGNRMNRNSGRLRRR